MTTAANRSAQTNLTGNVRHIFSAIRFSYAARPMRLVRCQASGAPLKSATQEMGEIHAPVLLLGVKENRRSLVPSPLAQLERWR
jgi:hypothetical protein